jgi:uncharacterized protein
VHHGREFYDMLHGTLEKMCREKDVKFEPLTFEAVVRTIQVLA